MGMGAGRPTGWLWPGVGTVLVLAGGIGWRPAPTHGAPPDGGLTDGILTDEEMVGAPLAVPEREPVSAGLPGGDIPEAARSKAQTPGPRISNEKNSGQSTSGQKASDQKSSDERRQGLTDAEREARRFRRADRDKDGTVSQEEFLASRRKSFNRLDTNRDGNLSFEEYAASTTARFVAADRNADRKLNRSEFAETATTRPAKPRPASSSAARNAARSPNQESASLEGDGPAS